jgi:hypothetical protein
MRTENPDDLLPDPKVAQRYGVDLRSIGRWDKDRALGFPAAINIKGRNYRRRRELEEFERRQVVKRGA